MIYDEYEPCPKCGLRCHRLEFKPSETLQLRRTMEEGVTPEYIRVTCGACGYEWSRLPKDTTKGGQIGNNP